MEFMELYAILHIVDGLEIKPTRLDTSVKDGRFLEVRFHRTCSFAPYLNSSLNVRIEANQHIHINPTAAPNDNPPIKIIPSLLVLGASPVNISPLKPTVCVPVG
jgi:hypothetical protein